MKVRIRAFAAYREILGADSLEVDLPEGSTVRAAFESLFAGRADFDRISRSTLFAVNQEYVSAQHPLRAGDELVFLPPLAGGS